MKKFSAAFGTPTNYSGCNRESWPLRTEHLHRQQCMEIDREKTKTGVQRIEGKYGIRCSVLLGLPYYDPIRFVAIDTMHNLFLGTGKKMFKLWVECGILTPESICQIEDKVRCFKVPPDVGRIPYRISSKYGGFTASQWRNWITIYSPVVLKGILEQQHLQCWLLFVRACSLLCKRIITKEDVASADLFLVTFCKKFEEIYGGNEFTYNMHLHMHLKQCLLDFGPSHSFWCFSFERFNGLLGSYSTNKKAIEVQVMRRFCNAQDTYSLIPHIDSDLQNILPVSKKRNASISALGIDDSATISLLNMCHASLSSISSFENAGVVTLLPPLKEQVLTSDECSELRKIYTQLYPTAAISNISHFYIYCKQVALGGDVIGSVKCGSASSVIMAYWPTQGDDLSNIDYTSRMSVALYNILCSTQYP